MHAQKTYLYFTLHCKSDNLFISVYFDIFIVASSFKLNQSTSPDNKYMIRVSDFLNKNNKEICTYIFESKNNKLKNLKLKSVKFTNLE